MAKFKVKTSVPEVPTTPSTPTPFEVTEVRLHEHPDPDCMAEYWQAVRFGKKVFLGIENAPITFWPQQSMPESPEELRAKGIICLDVGEGPLDHHPHGKCPDKCGSDLMAEYLGINHEIALSRILAYINMHDLEGPTSTSRALRDIGVDETLVQKVALLESAVLANDISLVRGKLDNLALIEYVMNKLDLWYRQQRYFWTKVKKVYESLLLKNKKEKEWAEKYAIYGFDPAENDPSRRQKQYRAITIVSSVREVGSFSRTRDAGFCHICVHRDPNTGHTFVTGQLKPHQYGEIAKFLRVLEMQKRGVETEYKLEDLGESLFTTCPIWYLPKNKQGNIFNIMNGGEKAQEVNPSKLDLDEIKDCLVLGLDNNIFAPECPGDKCLGNACSFWQFGLTRCQPIKSQTA